MHPHPASPFPSEEEGQLLYQALLLRSLATATYDFASAYLPALNAWLQARNPRLSPDLCDEAAVEAVYNFLKAPEQFDPNRGIPLAAFLRLAARRDLLNLLKREKRHAHQALDDKVVELRVVVGNHSGEKGPLLALCDREDEQERLAILAGVRSMLTEPEQRVLDLMLEGERDTPLFAAALGLAHLSAEEQEIEVKRVKDRIKARIKRWR